MYESPSLNENIAKQLDILAEKLLSGEIDPKAFLESTFELDQSDPERKSSIRAAEILIRPEVSNIFIGSDNEVNFYNIRSITFFHKAQISLSEGDTEVLEDLEQALADSKKTGEDFRDWINYVQATIAYLKNDIEQLQLSAEQIHSNRELVQNFVKGLKKRGFPDYISDYSRPRN